MNQTTSSDEVLYEEEAPPAPVLDKAMLPLLDSTRATTVVVVKTTAFTVHIEVVPELTTVSVVMGVVAGGKGEIMVV